MNQNGRKYFGTEKNKFENVFLAYFPKVKAFVHKFIGVDSDSEDIAQDIFVKLWFQMEDIDYVKYMDAYLYKMARNAVYDYVKHQKVSLAYVERYKKENTDEDNAYDLIYSRETKERIDRAIANMPPQRKKVFLMSRKEGLSNLEIAQKLNLSKKTVDNHIAWAVAELKKIVCFSLFFIFN